jgi:glycosyltransferase involved in cell wall biosynthesis
MVMAGERNIAWREVQENSRSPLKLESRLSVVILTLNEEHNLPDCLASLTGLDCDVFVIDSGSTDRTIEIALNEGARVASHPFENYSAQRNWAQDQLPDSARWVLHLDADERLTPQLVEEIRHLLTEDPPADGFLLRKRTVFMERWIKHGGHYPSYHLRLFRKSKGFCEERLYDQHFLVSGTVRTLKHDYIDVVCSDLTTWVRRHVRWADLEARQMLSESQGDNAVKAAAFGSQIQRKRWLRQLYGRAPRFIRPFFYFAYRYLFRLGFLDGKEGLIFHFLQGCWFRFLIDARIDEIQRIGNR